MVPIADRQTDSSSIWGHKFPRAQTMQSLANELHLVIGLGEEWVLRSSHRSCWTAERLQLLAMPHETHWAPAWA